MASEGEIWLLHLEPVEFDELALWCIEHGVMLSRLMTREELEKKWGPGGRVEVEEEECIDGGSGEEDRDL